MQRTQDLGANWLIVVLLMLLCITLLFSQPVRCIFVLALPSLGSSRGRALLITLAFFVAALGPTANIMTNLKVLLRSLGCGQELLRQAIGQMMDVVLEPIKAVQLAIELLLDEVRRVLRLVMDLLIHIQGFILYFIDTIQNCTVWLKSVLDLCNSQLGTPWERCQKSAQRAMVKCRDNLGFIKYICNATKLFLALCSPARLVDVFCIGFWEHSWDFLDTLLDRYYDFVADLEQMFDASISFDHDFYFHTNASKNLSDVGEQIIQDVTQSLRPFTIVQSWLDLLCWLMLLSVFINATFFYFHYMLSHHYQNVYLTSTFYVIDRQLQFQGKSTVLPLKRLERGKYLNLTSLRLTTSECLLMAEHAFFLFISCLQLFIICCVDYSLFWLLASISYYGHKQDDLEVPAYIDLEIKGGGFVGDIMRGIAQAFRPLTQKRTLDTKACLPLPVEPLYRHYLEILVLCLFAWLILLTEPYMLRLRHLIMQRFYPERAYVRALHLHDKIFQERASFFKFARRKARAVFKYQEKGNPNWLRRKLCCCCCLFGDLREDVCIICAKLLSSSTRINCDSPGCKGVYCKICFSESNNKCCLCKRPIDSGDYSDFSEVQDSSDDPDAESFGQKQARLYCGNRSGSSRQQAETLF
ncbi:DC-STAMP domain-containing protein 2-like isoform X2 [Drosophila innubila]|uniref:DC-STAMP domain-containing protein 2-like isoform X2 n=1 Tax=Drosophila innubila TaxID=198719 RepID=UPI00148D7165|nr:DC-STAMP domain-containing protein 2-like isoform X2 [Drosophila innubila]